MGRVTLQTVADRVGVSRMTVSNAFSRPDQLSAPLRERILAAADELGYVGPDPAGRALARGTVGAVGILLTKSLTYAFTDEVATGFLGAIAGVLEPSGVALTLLTSPKEGGAVPARDVALDGALVYSCEDNTPALEWLVRRGLPLVYVDLSPVPGSTCVNIDDRGGARAAAQHLLDLGHRRIGLVDLGLSAPAGQLVDPRAETPLYTMSHRMAGWLDALDAAGVVPTAANQGLNDEDEAYASAQLLLSQPEPPTALLCYSDVLARGVVRAVQDLGLDVPGDVSVVGFDDNPLAARMRPALTTVRQPIEEKGRLAATALSAAIDAAKAGEPIEHHHHVLPTELVVRETTGPPPA